MEGEIVFYDPSILEDPPELVEDTTSPLGRLFARWNERNRRARDEYERRNYEIWRSERSRRYL